MSRLRDWLGHSLTALGSRLPSRETIAGKWLPTSFLFWSAIAVLGVVVADSLSPESKTLTSFEGRTESMSYWPGNRDGFFLEFDRAWIERARLGDGSPSRFEGSCAEGVTIIGDPGRLEIERLHTDPQLLVISSEAGSQVSLISSDTQEAELVTGPLFLHLRGGAAAELECATEKVVRLPIEGLIQVGGENADGAGKLLEGVLTIFGRAEPGFISMVAGGEGSSTDTIIYSAGTLDLPVGSRVGNGSGDNQSNQWIGFIEADLNSDTPGFAANLQTSASEVQVWNQAADATRPDKISMGWTARLAGDPYFQWLVGILAASFAIVGIMANRFPVRD